MRFVKKPFEIIVIKRSKYSWPIIKGKRKQYIKVTYFDECEPNRYLFNEKVMRIDDWNRAAKLHNERRARKGWI